MRKIVEKGKEYKLIKSCKTENSAKRLADKLEKQNGRSKRFRAIIDHINMPLYHGSKFHYRRFKVYVPVEWRI